MGRIVLVWVVGVMVWVGGATAARACKITGASPFMLFDRAETVAVGRLASFVTPRRGTEGEARVVITESLRGASDRVTVKFGNSSCDPRVRRTRSAVLVFANADRTIAGRYLGFVVDPSEPLLDALRRWSTAASAGDRVDVLVDAIGGADIPVGRAAVEVAESSSFQRTLDAKQRARLAKATKRFHAERFDDDLAGFYGKPKAFFGAHDFSATQSSDDLAERIATAKDDAERIEAYERCGLLRGRVWRVQGPIDDDSWALRADNCRRGTLSVDLECATVLGVATSECAAHDFEAITDTNALADTMRAAVGASRLPERVKAYERCARIHALFSNQLDVGVWVQTVVLDAHTERRWRRHTAICRSGDRFHR